MWYVLHGFVHLQRNFNNSLLPITKNITGITSVMLYLFLMCIRLNLKNKVGFICVYIFS
jgi:hypothetical protein